MHNSNGNIVTAPIIHKTKKPFIHNKHNKFRVAGTVQAHSVLVNMATNMFQFHDLLSSHGLKENYQDLNDNLEIGVLNGGRLL